MLSPGAAFASEEALTTKVATATQMTRRALFISYPFTCVDMGRVGFTLAPPPASVTTFAEGFNASPLCVFITHSGEDKPAGAPMQAGLLAALLKNA
jgi:hypothetical protein